MSRWHRNHPDQPHPFAHQLRCVSDYVPEDGKAAAVSKSDEHLTMVEDCENRESKLTDWERGFIDSLRTQLERGRTLSEKQADRLDAIWERVT